MFPSSRKPVFAEMARMLLWHVVDQLAAHARRDHAVGNGNGVVTVAAGALVGAAKGLGTHVDLDQRGLVLGVRWLWQ